MYKITEKVALNPTVTKMVIEAPLIAKKAKPAAFMGRLIHMLNRDLHRIAGQIRHGLPKLHDCYFIRTTVKFAQSVPE